MGRGSAEEWLVNNVLTFLYSRSVSTAGNNLKPFVVLKISCANSVYDVRPLTEQPAVALLGSSHPLQHMRGF